MKVVICVVVLSSLVGCSAANTSPYESRVYGGVVVCDLDGIDTAQLLGVDEISPALKSSQLMADFNNTSAQWTSSDINRSRCLSTRPQYGDRALRIAIPEDKWSGGYQFAYDVYFGADGQLIAIEARHRFIDI